MICGYLYLFWLRIPADRVFLESSMDSFIFFYRNMQKCFPALSPHYCATFVWPFFHDAHYHYHVIFIVLFFAFLAFSRSIIVHRYFQLHCPNQLFSISYQFLTMIVSDIKSSTWNISYLLIKLQCSSLFQIVNFPWINFRALPRNSWVLTVSH